MDVALFVTCLTDSFFPRVGEAVVRVLRHFDCHVEFPPEQTCCGQPAFNSGCHNDAAAVAKHHIEVFEPYDCVVTPSASCAKMITEHAVELLADDPQWRDRAKAAAAKTFEFNVFLRDKLKVDPSEYLKFSEPVTFHYPCHARDVYTLDELQQWLSGDGVDLRVPEFPDLCCGFGGVFAVDFPPISEGMLGDKLDQLQSTGAKLVICNEAGCGLNMIGGVKRKGLDLRFKHIAECLAESLGLMESTS